MAHPYAKHRPGRDKAHRLVGVGGFNQAKARDNALRDALRARAFKTKAATGPYDEND